MIGKKKAKSYIASKEAKQKNSNITQVRFDRPYGKPAKTPKVVESDDEDEGRSSAFKSKRKKLERDLLKSGEDAEKVELVNRSAGVVGDEESLALETDAAKGLVEAQSDSNSGEDNAKTMKSKKQKSKKGSYLDEILAERSRRKKKKDNQKQAVS